MDDSQAVLLKKRFKRLSKYLDKLEEYLLSIKEGKQGFEGRTIQDLVEEQDRLAKQQVALIEAFRRCGVNFDDEIDPTLLSLARSLSSLKPSELVKLRKSLIHSVEKRDPLSKVGAKIDSSK